MTDEQRADSMSYVGTQTVSARTAAHTPNLDRFANAGTIFSAAYTASPVCVSARACLLTGRYGSTIGVLNNHHRLVLDDPRFLTWTFAANGYQVASFGKQHYNCGRRAFDLEAGQVLGDRVHYFSYRVPVDSRQAGVVRYDGGKSPWLFAGRFPGTVDDTPEMHNVEQALHWLTARDPSRPFFLRLSFNAPHTPVVTPAPFDTLVDAAAQDLPIDRPTDMTFASTTHRDYLCDYAGTQRLTDEQVRRARQCYFGYVACVDHVFGRLLRAMRERGELENTLIAFVTDHGTHLGDHGFFQKQSFWEASVRVPFFITGPGVQNQTVETPVNTGSLLPTLLDLAGLRVPPQVQFPSLGPTLRQGCLPGAAPVFSEIDYGIWGYRSGDRRVMVRDGRWKLWLYRHPRDPSRFLDGEDRVLYDLETDPTESTNLADDPAYASVAKALVAKIDAWDRERPIVTPTLVESKEES
jgi:arylsulfatase A-like enzyme